MNKKHTASVEDNKVGVGGAICLLIAVLAVLALFWLFPPTASAFFWQNEPELSKQEIYEQDAKTREMARQVFVQATLTSLKSQKEYAKEKATTAIVEEDTVELDRLAKVISNLSREITSVQQHTKIVFMSVER